MSALLMPTHPPPLKEAAAQLSWTEMLVPCDLTAHSCRFLSCALQGFPGDIGPPGQNGPEGVKVSRAPRSQTSLAAANENKRTGGGWRGERKTLEIPADSACLS